MKRHGLKSDGRTEGFMLLALIFALMVMSIWMAVAVPDVRIQAQREAEADMLYAGDQMAEAIARYYSGGRLTTAGLVVKAPSYGYLSELRKLRDGVSIGIKNVRFVRGSAFIDPITHEEWEPVRIGDPRLKKFLLAWSRSTGRPIPQTYLGYLGVITTDDIEDQDDEDGESGAGSGDTPKPGAQPVQPPVVGDDEDEEEEDWEDEDDDEGEDDGDDEGEDEGDEMDKAISGPVAGPSPFLHVALQTQPGVGQGTPPPAPPQTPAGRGPLQRARPAPVFRAGDSKNPIIGVVSKSKRKAVRTRFGIESHDQMLFIYMPPPPRGALRLGPQQQNPVQQSSGPGPSFPDANNDGIDDRHQTEQPKP
jgi:type II secretory pathway pseudopilin PulG